ncbi:MAG: TIM barrel protein, partial [Promethearchaeota archaeon]
LVKFSLIPKIFVVHVQKKVRHWNVALENIRFSIGYLNEKLKENAMGQYIDNFKFAIENLPNKAFQDEISLKEIPNLSDWPENMGFCIDTTHYAQETSKLLGFLGKVNELGKLFHIHASDFITKKIVAEIEDRTHLNSKLNSKLKDNGNYWINPFTNKVQKYHIPPSDYGVIDWSEFLKGLIKLEYKGGIVIECMNAVQEIAGLKYIKKTAENLTI